MRTVTYDATTDNGIQYISTLYAANYDYQRVVTDLDSLVTTRDSLLGGAGSVTSYSLGSRSVTRQALSGNDVLALWDKLWARKLQLEHVRKPRKAVGVVPRDW